MYERFTDRARKVMQLARQEAQHFNHEWVGTEHIIIGLIKEGSGIACNVLRNLGFDLGKIRDEVCKDVKPGPTKVLMSKQPLTARMSRVIEYSLQEARDLQHNYVGTEHLLLGLLHEPEGIAGMAIAQLFPVSLEQVRKEIISLLGQFSLDNRGIFPVEGDIPEPEWTSFTMNMLCLPNPEMYTEEVKLLHSLATKDQPGMTSSDRLAKIAAISTKLCKLFGVKEV